MPERFAVLIESLLTLGASAAGAALRFERVIGALASELRLERVIGALASELRLERVTGAVSSELLLERVTGAVSLERGVTSLATAITTGAGAGFEVNSARSMFRSLAVEAETETALTATRSAERPSTGTALASRDTLPWAAGTPKVSTRPDAAAMTAAWRPTDPAFEATAFEMDSNGLVRTGVARWRPNAA